MTPEIEALMDRHLPGRLDGEPLLFKGMTLSEITTVLTVAAVGWLPVSIVVSVFIIHVWPVFIGLWALAIGLTLYFGGVWLQRMKRNRPDGYHEQRMKLKMHRYGFAKGLEYAYRPGKWNTTRTIGATSKKQGGNKR